MVLKVIVPHLYKSFKFSFDGGGGDAFLFLDFQSPAY